MRCIVVGTSGAGKTRFARDLASSLALPCIELDALFWEPNWSAAELVTFRQRVAAATQADAWVVDGNYSSVRAELWPRATHVVWLNFGRFTVFSRIVGRTFWRVASRQKLWAGNQESFAKAFLSRDSILMWSFTTFSKNQLKFAGLRQSSEFGHLQWHELRSPAQARAFLRARQRDADPLP